MTLRREDQWPATCPLGILDTMADAGKWLVRPWEPSARNVSAAARTLAHSKSGKGKT